jgi:hypothetical protein
LSEWPPPSSKVNFRFHLVSRGGISLVGSYAVLLSELQTDFGKFAYLPMQHGSTEGTADQKQAVLNAIAGRQAQLK